MYGKSKVKEADEVRVDDEARVCFDNLQASEAISSTGGDGILACSLAIIGEVGGESIQYQHLPEG